MCMPPQRAVLLAILVSSLFLSACSGGSIGSSSGGSAPVFTNAPGTAATQGSTYTYQIQSQPTSGVTYTLTNAPTGATLSGNTITWTPTSAQSRVPNQFAVTATSPSGSATQSWSVTPSGTVSGTWIDTQWTSDGPVSLPFNWTLSSSGLVDFLDGQPVPNNPVALVPQPDGSFKTLTGSGNSDGTFSIPNVPGGYFWLAPATGTAALPATRPVMYWTNSSAIDFGEDLGTSGGFSGAIDPGPGAGSGVISLGTTVQIAYSGLDPLQLGDELEFLWNPLSILSTSPSPIGATSFTTGPVNSTSTDLFVVTPTAFALQYEPEPLGALNALKLGPAEVMPNPLPQIQTGVANTVNATLAPSPQNSFPLSIKGSAWSALFNNAAASPLTLSETSFALEAVPFMTGSGIAPAITPSLGLRVPLIGVQAVPSLSECGPSGSNPTGVSPSGSTITSDQDFGIVNYGDPFPSTWGRVFTFCQTGTVSIPFPGSTNPVSFLLTDSQSTVVPTSQVSPLITHVQNPTINGMSIFQANTIPSTGVTLNWASPSGNLPTGYSIEVFAATSDLTGFLTGTSALETYAPYFPYSPLYTAKTSAVLPPLPSGHTYVFVITAILDGAANFETKPNRSALPTASVSVISAPITTQ